MTSPSPRLPSFFILPRAAREPVRPQPAYYLRRCRRCSNFMNWLLRPDGSARCQDCGADHPAETYPDHRPPVLDFSAR